MFLSDPLGAVDPEFLESADGLHQLMDEFHAELLVELIGIIGGEGMFPRISTLRLLWALYRWAIARIRGSRGRRLGGPPMRDLAVLTRATCSTNSLAVTRFQVEIDPEQGSWTVTARRRFEFGAENFDDGPGECRFPHPVETRRTRTTRRTQVDPRHR